MDEIEELWLYYLILTLCPSATHQGLVWCSAYCYHRDPWNKYGRKPHGGDASVLPRCYWSGLWYLQEKQFVTSYVVV